MTATREVSIGHPNVDGSADISIEILDEEEDVYFTDQEPRFRITVENNTEYDFNKGSHIAWVIAIGEGRPEPFVRKQYSEFTISPGEKRSVEVSGEPLSLEGHGIVAIGDGSFHDVKHDDKEIRFTAGRTQKDRYEPLATFSVWDREHYEVVHEQPQRTQHFTLFASMGIVFFAILQVGEIIGYPLLGLGGGLVLLALYWYSGFMGDFIKALQERRRAIN